MQKNYFVKSETRLSIRYNTHYGEKEGTCEFNEPYRKIPKRAFKPQVQHLVEIVQMACILLNWMPSISVRSHYHLNNNANVVSEQHFKFVTMKMYCVTNSTVFYSAAIQKETNKRNEWMDVEWKVFKGLNIFRINENGICRVKYGQMITRKL